MPKPPVPAACLEIVANPRLKQTCNIVAGTFRQSLPLAELEEAAAVVGAHTKALREPLTKLGPHTSGIR